MSTTETTPPSGQSPLTSAFPDADVLCSDVHRLHLICCRHSFLYDHHSPVHSFYKERLQEYRAAAAQNTPAPAEAEAAPPTLNHSSVPSSQDAEPVPVKRKRKSRWGSEDDKVNLPMPSIVIPQEINIPDPNAPSLSGTLQLWISSVTSDNLSIISELFHFVLLPGAAQELRGLGYTKGKPVGLVGVTELSDDQKRQIKEQQDVGNHYKPFYLKSPPFSVTPP